MDVGKRTTGGPALSLMVVTLINLALALAIVFGAWMNVRAAKTNRQTAELLQQSASSLGEAAQKASEATTEALRRVSARDN